MKFNQADIQQLQQVLREQISSLTLHRAFCLSDAKQYSKIGNKEVSTDLYTNAENQQKKINKLAELQRKLKRTKYALVQTFPRFEEDFMEDDL